MTQFYKWKGCYLEGGKRVLAEGPLGNEYEKRIDELTNIINELKKSAWR